MSDFCACLGEDQINQKAEQVADAYIQQVVERGICPKAAMVALARSLRILEVQLADQGDLITAEEALKSAPLETARASLDRIDSIIMAQGEAVLELLRSGDVVIAGVNSRTSKKSH